MTISYNGNPMKNKTARRKGILAKQMAEKYLDLRGSSGFVRNKKVSIRQIEREENNEIGIPVGEAGNMQCITFLESFKANGYKMPVSRREAFKQLTGCLEDVCGGVEATIEKLKKEKKITLQGYC